MDNGLCIAQLIQETEEPEGDATTMAYFGVINTKETVGLVGNLLEGLATASYLEEVFVVDIEIAFLGVLHLVAYNELVIEEGFALVAFLDTGAEGMHEVGVAQEDLVGLVEVLIILGLGGKETQNLGFVEGIEHTEPQLVVGGKGRPKVGHGGLEGYALGDNHEEALNLLDGLESDVLYGRQVIVDDYSDSLAKAREKVFDGLFIEGIISVLEIGLEEGGDLDLLGDLHCIAHVILKDIIEGEGIVGEDSFVGKELTEGHAIKGVCGLATREVDLGIIHNKERGAGIYNAHVGIVVVDVLEVDRPLVVAVNFVEVEAHDAVLIGPIDEVHERMGGEPEVVERGIEGLVDVLIVFEDVLQEHGSLAHATGAFDAYETGIPVDLGIEIALEAQVNPGELAMIGIEQGL
jgi:hypothetical protein